MFDNFYNVNFLGTFEVINNKNYPAYGLYTGTPFAEDVRPTSRRQGGAVVTGVYGAAVSFRDDGRLDKLITWLMNPDKSDQEGFGNENPDYYEWESQGRLAVHEGAFGIFSREAIEFMPLETRMELFTQQIELANRGEASTEESLASMLFSFSKKINDNIYITPMGVIITNRPECEVRTFTAEHGFKYCGHGVQFTYFDDTTF